VRILLTGDYDRDEFARAIDEMSGVADVLRVASLTSAAQSLASGEVLVTVIVVAQSRPGQFSTSEIDSLRRAAPLTPIVALLGSWCEGAMRSGSLWPGVTRIYWHQWTERFRYECLMAARGEPSAWSLPLTATIEERLLWSPRPSRRGVDGIAAVVSDDIEMADWLAAACEDRGMSTIKLRRAPAEQIEGVASLLWDLGLPVAAAIEAFRFGAARFGRAYRIVLADFHRAEDVERLSALSTTSVLAKPLIVNDLHACLDGHIFDY
jgi:hypothetical protein